MWGTAFLRAATAATGKSEVDGATAVAMLRAAIEGIATRGNASLGDKTLLDALVPATDEIERQIGLGADGPTTVRAAATVARSSADETAKLAGPPRAGPATPASAASAASTPAPIAVAVIFEALADTWTARAEGGPS